MLKLKRCHQPDLKLPKLLCDEKIHKKLDDFPLTSLMNKSFACLIAGKAGTGKTSLLVSILSNSKLFKRCFHKIFLFMPANSRASLKDSIFDELPEEQVIDDLSLESLSIVYEQIQSYGKNDLRSLIIFDDVQQFFKGECEKLITHLIANRRHNRLSMFFLAQTYKKVPRPCRLGMSDLFCFKLSKSDLDDIKSELVDIQESAWNKVLQLYNKHIKTHPRSFLFINTNTNRMFINWDEIVLDNEEECSEEENPSKKIKLT